MPILVVGPATDDALFGAHDADSHRLTEPEGAAHGHHRLGDMQPVGTHERQHRATQAHRLEFTSHLFLVPAACSRRRSQTYSEAIVRSVARITALLRRT